MLGAEWGNQYHGESAFTFIGKGASKSSLFGRDVESLCIEIISEVFMNFNDGL